MHPLMSYTDLMETNYVGNTNTHLLHCFRFISKLKAKSNTIIGLHLKLDSIGHLVTWEKLGYQTLFSWLLP